MMDLSKIIGLSIIAIPFGFLLAYMVGWRKNFWCRIGWHSHGYDATEFDGCSVHARCKWCGYEGLIDSQGNLF